MPLRESSASPPKGLRGVINFPWKKRPKKRNGHGKIHTAPASSIPATPPKTTAERFMKGIDASQSAQSSPAPSSVGPQSPPEQVASPPSLSKSSIQPPATPVSGASPQLASLPQTVPVAQSTTSDTVSSPSSDMPERLWNQAYDELKKENDTWVEAYERILSDKLNRGGSSCTDLESQKNEFNDRDLAKRQSMMEELVRTGLKKTEKEAKVKQIIGEAMQGALTIKDMIGFALQSVPQATLAWAGVCFALQILLNPTTETKANREGILRSVKRMPSVEVTLERSVLIEIRVSRRQRDRYGTLFSQ